MSHAPYTLIAPIVSQLALVQKSAMDENCTTMESPYSECQRSQRKHKVLSSKSFNNMEVLELEVVIRGQDPF